MKIAILDIETTGFSKDRDKIVEIGIVDLNLETGEKKIVFDSVCHETGITRAEVERSWIVRNNYISVEEIRTSPNLRKIKDDIQHILYKYPIGITAFNNQFDFGFMEYRGFHFPRKLSCPMLLSTNVCKIPRQGKRNGTNEYKWPSVEEAYKHFFPNSTYIEKHRGADDAFHEADIVKALYDLKIFIV